MGGKWFSDKFIQSLENPEPQGNAAAEPAGNRHVTADAPAKVERVLARLLKEGGGALSYHWMFRRATRFRVDPSLRYGYLIVDRQGNSQTIVAGADIRRAARNADADTGFS